MKCMQCGKQISDDSKYCNECGNEIKPDDSKKRAGGIRNTLALLRKSDLRFVSVLSIVVGLLLMTNENRFNEASANVIDHFANAFITTGVIGIWFKIAGDSKLIKSVIEDISAVYKKQMKAEIENHLNRLDKANETMSIGMIKTSISECTKKCSDKMVIRYKLLEEAGHVGLEHIFYRKTDDDRRGLDLLFSSIQEQINSKIGEIYIVGIAALEIFPISEPGNRYEKLFEGYLVDNNNKCQVKILLLDPDSNAAKLKAKLEYSHDTIGHIKGTIKKLDMYNHRDNIVNKLDYRKYNSMPIALIFMTSSRLFLEPYPNVNINKPTQNLNGPIGGRTPMIVITKDSEAYRRWKAHVEHLWEFYTEEYPGSTIELLDIESSTNA